MKKQLSLLIIAVALAGFAPAPWAQDSNAAKSDVLVYAPAFDAACYSVQQEGLLQYFKVNSLEPLERYLENLGFNTEIALAAAENAEELRSKIQGAKVVVFLSCSKELGPEEVRVVREEVGKGTAVVIDAFGAAHNASQPLLEEFGYSVASPLFEVEESTPLKKKTGMEPSQSFSSVNVTEYKDVYLFDKPLGAGVVLKEHLTLQSGSEVAYMGPVLKSPAQGNNTSLIGLTTEEGADADVFGKEYGQGTGMLFLEKLAGESKPQLVVTGCFFCMNNVLISNVLDYLQDKKTDYPEIKPRRDALPRTAKIRVGEKMLDRVVIDIPANAEIPTLTVTYTQSLQATCGGALVESQGGGFRNKSVSSTPIILEAEYEGVKETTGSGCRLPKATVFVSAKAGEKTLTREYEISEYPLAPGQVIVEKSTLFDDFGNEGREASQDSTYTVLGALAATIVLAGASYYALFLRKKSPETVRQDRITVLLTEKDKVNNVIEFAKRQWYARQIDDSAFKSILEENQKKLIEVYAELKQLGYKPPPHEAQKQEAKAGEATQQDGASGEKGGKENEG